MPVAVERVDQPAQQQPDSKSLPRRSRQPQHRVETREGPEQADPPDERHPERSRAIGLCVSEHQHADANDGERRQRADVGEVVDLVLVGDERTERHDDARDPCRDVRHAPLLAHLRRPRGKKPVARHREEDARLAVLKHQQHRRNRDHGAKRHDPAGGLEPGDFQCSGERVGRAKLHVRHEAGGDDTDDHVDQRADGQTAENSDGQVTLRILCLFGRRRDGVEADVGEEDDGRALVDAGPAVRAQRARSWPCRCASRQRQRTVPAPAA